MSQKRRPPKRILITHVYSSNNKGDAALTSVLIDDLKRTFNDANITILTLEPPKESKLFEGIPEKPSFMYWALNRYHHPLPKLIYTIYMVSATLVWALSHRLIDLRFFLPNHLRQVAEAYVQADLIVPVGGGYIRSRKGLMNRLNVPLLLHPLLFGYILGKPTVLYSQSVGPFSTNLERRMAAFVLKRMALILLREDTSMALLAKLGVSSNVSRAVDAGFLLTSKDTLHIRKLYRVPEETLLIGVTVRSWLQGKAQKEYEEAVARALDTIIDTTGARVIFIPQVTAAKGDDDRVTSRRVHKRMRRGASAIVIEDTPDHHQIKALYDGLDILLGTRFHSVIFSLTSYVPVVAIEYEHKTSGIMRDLKLDSWVVSIETVTADQLISLLQKAINERVVYRTHLRKYVPPYVQRARKTVDLLAEHYFDAKNV